MDAFTLNVRGELYKYDKPAVMGIINATPDSFYSPSRVADASEAAVRAARMISFGADMIDVGACSTRPGSSSPSAQEEIDRLEPVLKAVKSAVEGTKVLISVDTYRADVARAAVELGADIVNDIAGGNLDAAMFDTVAELKVPYVLSHMRGTPENMQEFTVYENVTRDVLSELGDRLQQLSLLGVNDVIIDPGFGFSKTLEQNYELLAHLDLFKLFHRPLLVGFSRKSMITKLLGIKSEESLEGTTTLNTLAIDRGAAIVRVHDVKAARQAVDIYCAMTAQASK